MSICTYCTICENNDKKRRLPKAKKEKISVQLHYVYPFNVGVQMGLKDKASLVL